MRKRKPHELRSTSIEWLVEVPENWNLVKMGYITRIDTGNKDTQDSVEEGRYPFFVRSETIESLDSYSIDTEAVMTSGDGAGVCKIYHHYKGKFALHQRMYAVYSFKDVIGRYIYYSMIGNFKKEVFKLSAKSTVDSLRMPMLKNFPIALPSEPEQKAITTFLDRKTQAIDQLIEKKQQLIEKLKEKRQALITKAVTKGLDPDAPMKDSGIEWLGEVPEHWEIEKCKHLFKEIDKRSETGTEELLSVSHKTGVTPRSEKDVNMFKAESNVGYKICEKDDLVINTMWAWMGALGISPLKGIVSPSYNIYRFKSPKLLKKYFDLYIKSPGFIVDVNRYSKGVWSSRLRLYPDAFFMISIPLPSVKEQTKIVELVDSSFRELDKVVSKIFDQIEKLKEYRQSLISEAVTGKIDVRDEVKALAK